MKVAILVHGFNNRESGKENIDKLRPYLEASNYKVLDLDYGWFGLLMARFGNQSVARKLADMIHEQPVGYEVHVFGHSNGCAIMHRASKLIRRVAVHYHYINPALRASHALHPVITSLRVWYSPSDIAVKAAKWGQILRLVPKHWGGMGYLGYCGPADPRVTDHNIELEYMLRSTTFKTMGHSDIFDNLEALAPALLGAV